MPENWHELPWSTLLVLAAGYAGYVVANLGTRAHHQTVDVTFASLCFGFLAAFFYESLRRIFGWEILSASALAFVFAIVLGAVWGRWARPGFYWVLRKLGVSANNDLQSAWQELFVTPGMHSTQLTVVLASGKLYFCDNLSRFEAYPHGPCVLGGSGDVLMYVTHMQEKPGAPVNACAGLVDPGTGTAEITYIPQSEIARIDIRRGYLKKMITSDEAAAEVTPAET